MFHGNLVHGSAGNITPFPRKIVYLTLNAVSNYIRKPTRPEWIAHQDFRRSSPAPTMPCCAMPGPIGRRRSRGGVRPSGSDPMAQPCGARYQTLRV